MQTANRRLGVVGDDEDEVLTNNSPSVFRIITGKKTLSTVIPYVKKSQETEFRPRVFLPTVRATATVASRASKRTKPPRLITIDDLRHGVNDNEYKEYGDGEVFATFPSAPL